MLKGPFSSFLGGIQVTKSNDFTALAFQKDGDAIYREVGDTVSVWSFGDYTQANTETAGFILAGAA